MNTLKEEKKARILTLNNQLVSDNEKSISEVTRNLFSDAWRSYLDQTSMAAIKVKRVTLSNTEENVTVVNSNLEVVETCSKA
jgi:hypothetical protein